MGKHGIRSKRRKSTPTELYPKLKGKGGGGIRLDSLEKNLRHRNPNQKIIKGKEKEKQYVQNNTNRVGKFSRNCNGNILNEGHLGSTDDAFCTVSADLDLSPFSRSRNLGRMMESLTKGAK